MTLTRSSRLVLAAVTVLLASLLSAPPTFAIAPVSDTFSGACMGGANAGRICTVATQGADCPGSTCNNQALSGVTWTAVDPVAGCGVTPTALVASGLLTLSLAGCSRDQYPTANSGYRVMQTVTDTAFTVEARFPVMPQTDSQTLGLLVRQDDTNYLRFDRIRNVNGSFFFTALVINNAIVGSNVFCYSSGSGVNADACTAHTTSGAFFLKVSRVGGSTFKLFYSMDADGTPNTADAYTLMETTTTSALGVAQVGVYAAAKGGGQTFAAQIDRFTAIAPTLAIDAQPRSTTESEGQTATFSVSASGAPGATLSYQWQLDADGTGAGSFASIGGATATSYTTGALTVATHNGDLYRVIVSHDLSGTVTTATSTTATLTVVARTIRYVDNRNGIAIVDDMLYFDGCSDETTGDIDHDGTTGNGGKNRNLPLCTVERAHTVSTPEDIINVYPSVYPIAATMNLGRSNAGVDGQRPGQTWQRWPGTEALGRAQLDFQNLSESGIYIKANDITLDGFKLYNMKPNTAISANRWGVSIQSYLGAVVQNNEIVIPSDAGACISCQGGIGIQGGRFLVKDNILRGGFSFGIWPQSTGPLYRGSGPYVGLDPVDAGGSIIGNYVLMENLNSDSSQVGLMTEAVGISGQKTALSGCSGPCAEGAYAKIIIANNIFDRPQRNVGRTWAMFLRETAISLRIFGNYMKNLGTCIYTQEDKGQPVGHCTDNAAIACYNDDDCLGAATCTTRNENRCNGRPETWCTNTHVPCVAGACSGGESCTDHKVICTSNTPCSSFGQTCDTDCSTCAEMTTGAANTGTCPTEDIRIFNNTCDHGTLDVTTYGAIYSVGCYSTPVVSNNLIRDYPAPAITFAGAGGTHCSSPCQYGGGSTDSDRYKVGTVPGSWSNNLLWSSTGASTTLIQAKTQLCSATDTVCNTVADCSGAETCTTQSRNMNLVTPQWADIGVFASNRINVEPGVSTTTGVPLNQLAGVYNAGLTDPLGLCVGTVCQVGDGVRLIDYNYDRLGMRRGTGGAWDIGAFELGGSAGALPAKVIHHGRFTGQIN